MDEHRGHPIAFRLEAEGGFTIVEALVGLVLVVILFVGVATSLVVAVRHQKDVRLTQQAAAIGLEYIEFARSLPWTELELSAAPNATIPHHGSGNIDGAYFGIATDEPLVVDSGVYTADDPDPGLIDPGYATLETINGEDFQVYQYVTEVQSNLRRVVILVEWELAGSERTHVTSTEISELGAG